MKLERINLFFGLFLFVIFLMTGYYMKTYIKPIHLEHLPIRLQIRSNHIYLLFVALLNMFAFKTVIRSKLRISKTIDIVVRMSLIAAGVLSLLGFIYEHTGDISNRMFTLWTVILCLSSVGMFLLNECISFFRKENK